MSSYFTPVILRRKRRLPRKNHLQEDASIPKIFKQSLQRGDTIKVLNGSKDHEPYQISSLAIPVADALALCWDKISRQTFKTLDDPTLIRNDRVHQHFKFVRKKGQEYIFRHKKPQ